MRELKMKEYETNLIISDYGSHSFYDAFIMAVETRYLLMDSLLFFVSNLPFVLSRYYTTYQLNKNLKTSEL